MPSGNEQSQKDDEAFKRRAWIAVFLVSAVFWVAVGLVAWMFWY